MSSPLDPNVPQIGSQALYNAQGQRILRAGDEIRLKGHVKDNLFIVEEDVLQEVYPMGSKRPSYVSLYTKGQIIAQSELVSLRIG